MNECQIVVLFVVWGIISLGINLDFLARKDRVYFNPVENYKNWHCLNWLGVSVFTIIINLLFLPIAILYWISRFFAFIFTVGRR